MFDNLIRAVKNAGDKLKTDKFNIMSKGGYENIVTSADIWVQEYLYDEIKKDFPAAGFICEEEHLQRIIRTGTLLLSIPLTVRRISQGE